MATRAMPKPDTGPQLVLSPPSLVGREQELAALTAALAKPPAVVLVEGEAGIGKSRLIQEYVGRQACNERRMLLATCPPFAEPLTLGAVVDAVRQATDSVRGLPLTPLAGALRPLFPEWADDLPPMPEPAEDATAARHRLFRALHELLAHLDVAVLVVEDVHWADQATLEFLLFLTSRQPQPVSLVVTYRPEDVAADSLLRRLSGKASAAATQTRVQLPPLDVADTAALVSSMLNGERLSQAFAYFLHERTDGVPLAVEESVRLLHDRADLVRRDGEWMRVKLAELQVPPTVRDSTLERVARLPEDARRVLRAAAVLTEPVDERVVAELAAVPGAAGVADAVASGLLVDDDRGQLAFRHTLTCRAVYEAIPATERRRLHLAAGEMLERTDPPPVVQLTRHFREAGDTSRWCRYGEQVADRALAAGDEATAEGLLQELVAHGGLSSRDTARLVGKIPFAALTEPARYQDLVRALRSLLHAGTEDAELRYQLGRVLAAMDDWDAAHAELERAIPHLRDPAATARAMILLGLPFGAGRAAAEHVRWLQRADAVIASVASADRLSLVVDRAATFLMLGDAQGWAEAAEIPEDAPTADERFQVVRGHVNISDAAMRWGRYAEARQRLSRALELANAHQYTRYRGLALVTQAHLDWFAGAWDGLAARSTALAEDEDIQPLARLEALLIAGLLHVARGARAMAEDHFRRVLEEARKRGGVEYYAEYAAALSRLRLSEGQAGDALELTDEPMRAIAAKGTWLWATDLAPAHVQALTGTGQGDEAARLVAAFSRGMRGRAAQAPVAALATCRAFVAEACGQHHDAASRFARAACAWDSLPRPYDALLARERRAACLLAAGRSDPGLSLLSSVYEGLADLGATADAGRVAQLLRERGVQVRRRGRGGRPAYGDQLSPRERDVLRLLVTGRTDRQIAEALFLSPKTVGRHLDSARRKLKAPSRTALAVIAVEAGAVAGDRLADNR